MSGSLVIPNVFATQSGNVPVSQLDTDLSGIATYVNAREVTLGLLSARPAAGVSGRLYFATDTNGGTLYEDNGAVWTQLAPGVTQQGFIQGLVGCTLSNDGGSPTTVLDISAGACTDDNATVTSRVIMSISAMTGSISGTWVVGSGSNKLDTGTIASSTWYHVWVIQRPDTQVVDFLFSLSATAPTMPTNYTKKRRVGAFKTDGSSHIIAFVQQGDYFRWKASVADQVLKPGDTVAHTIALGSVPTGVNVEWYGTVVLHIVGTGTSALVSDLAANDEAPLAIGTTPIVAPGFTVSEGTANQSNASQERIRTDTSAQVRYRFTGGDANSEIGFITWGWYDRRGQDS